MRAQADATYAIELKRAVTVDLSMVERSMNEAAILGCGKSRRALMLMECASMPKSSISTCWSKINGVMLSFMTLT